MMPINPGVLWGLVAAIPAVALEWGYRVYPGESWFDHWYLWLLPTPIISYGIYNLVRLPNTSLIDAFVIWAFSTTAMRVFVSTVLLGDNVKGGTWFALGLLIMARIAQTFWGR